MTGTSVNVLRPVRFEENVEKLLQSKFLLNSMQMIFPSREYCDWVSTFAKPFIFSKQVLLRNILHFLRK